MSDWTTTEQLLGWQGPPMGDLEHRFDALDGPVEVRVKCPLCGRTLDKVSSLWWEVPWDPVPVVASLWLNEQTKPSVGRDPRAGVDVGGRTVEVRFRYRCHRRCGATYVVRLERLTVKYLDALEHRRNWFTI